MYAAISTTAAIPNAMYGSFNHVPGIIENLNFIHEFH
jgi:hypothetical protein